MEIPLSKGKVAIIDDEDYPKISHCKWHCSAYGYACACPHWKASSLYMHRLIMGAEKGQRIDHKNGDKLDNRKANLRFCSQGQNRMNCRKHSRRWRYKGVRKIKPHHNWQARISFQGREYALGTYRTAKEAARAYDAKARELFGEFAKCNFSVT